MRKSVGSSVSKSFLALVLACGLQGTEAWSASRIQSARQASLSASQSQYFRFCEWRRRSYVDLRQSVPCLSTTFRSLAFSLSSSSSSSSSSSLTERDQETLSLIRQAIDESEDAAAWEQSISFLASILTPADDIDTAEILLAEAFGWKRWVLSSATLRKYQKQPIVPAVESLQETMEWLLQGPLELSNDMALLQRCLSQYASLYLKDPQTLYRRAFQSAPRLYRDSDAFRMLVQQDPSVLDVFYNCGDEDDGCASNCGNCWVTYQRRL